MDTVQRVAKNTGIVVVGDVIFRLISLGVMIYLARYLGTANFGKYSFVFAYLAFFSIISDLGLYTILVREMSRDKSVAPKVIGNVYVIKLILTLFAVVLSIAVISFMSYPADMTTYIYIASFTIFFLSFTDLYVAIFQANLKMEYAVIEKLAFKVLSACLILWVIFSHGTMLQVFIALVVSEMVRTLISYFFSRKFVRPRFEIDFGLWKYLFKEALPIALSSVIWTIYHRVDVLMLSIMIGDASVGIYSAAYKLSEPLWLIPAALMMSLFPIMSASFKTSEEKLIKSYKLGIKYLLIITLPIAIGVTLIADRIIFLVYGADFAGSATAFQILIWSLVFTSIYLVLTNLLVAINKQKLNTISMIICAIINVILNIILIPTMSYNGAAIATVITTVVLLILSFYFVSKHLQLIPIHKILIKPVISALVMSAFIFYLIDINLFLLILSSGIVYLVALFALKTFTDEDKEIVKKLVNNIPWIKNRI